jgi:hypothetical protein
MRGRAEGLSPRALEDAISYARTNPGKFPNRDFVTIVDYTQPSTSKRMYIFDLRRGTVRRELAAHGENSGDLVPTDFGDVPGSYKTPGGFFATGSEYQGQFGRSMYLDGLEERNKLARFPRRIVVHGWDKVSEKTIRETGVIGWSQGCPAVPLSAINQIINETKGGSLFYMYTGQ